jgi:hypothetical protein
MELEAKTDSDTQEDSGVYSNEVETEMQEEQDEAKAKHWRETCYQKQGCPQTSGYDRSTRKMMLQPLTKSQVH